MKPDLRRSVSVFVLFLLLFSMLSCGGHTQPLGTEEPLPYVNELFCELTRREGYADLVMFRVGQADAMLLAGENCNILIDTGEEDDADADKIIEYLKFQNIERLDAVIVSNCLNDNIGGFARISEAFEIGNVIMPFYNAEGSRYTDFLRHVVQSNAQLHALTEPAEFVFDDITVTCHPAKDPLTCRSEEDLSLVVHLTHGNNTMLLCGNIREERINEVMQTLTDPCKLIKLPDHGFWFDGIGAFLDQYQPQYALISDSVINEVSYDMLSLLAEKNVTYYRTADANICITSNGKRIEAAQY